MGECGEVNGWIVKGEMETADFVQWADFKSSLEFSKLESWKLIVGAKKISRSL